jgi:FAD/FMN-containing dehydrogenase/Fe-S oxidoreductase
MRHSFSASYLQPIPQLGLSDTIQPLYLAFLQALQATAFQGEIRTDYASRLVTATDNSVYQSVPQAVIFPRSRADVIRFVTLASQPRFREITFSPRGGGTGTNGQSLCVGLVVDLSKHLNRLLQVNLEDGWVRVEPGVVLDQLNAHLKPQGVFFAPTVAPSSRATLGGMINTDACGKGSRIYGKTSNHIVSLHVVLLDGTCWESQALSLQELAVIKERYDRVGEIYRCVDQIVTTHQDLIAAQFPKLKRFLTGYNLAHVHDAQRQTFNLNPILAGSEGTLGFVVEAKLKLTKIPAYKQLVMVKYASFDDALAAAQELLEADPAAVETIDEAILALAREDLIWHAVGKFLQDEGSPPTRTINLVEFESDDRQEVESKTQQLLATIKAQQGQPRKAIGYYAAQNASEAAALWELRKSGVGLLGNAKGERRPVPFVEDTAVPPEHLAAYIHEFRTLLDDAGLQYGMFGHVDVGCLHVRPALNLRDPQDEALLRTISDQVVTLVKKYGGVLWAEHGKGYRSEYSPHFFGETLYTELRRIKEVFDPYNQLNPGKLATPISRDDTLITINGITRGFFDRQITTRALQKYATTVTCNGNGACFHYDPDYVMCPSSKVTRDRIHSPKGRAGIMREWLRQLSVAGFDPGAADVHQKSIPVIGLLIRLWNSLKQRWGSYDFSHEVYAAMDGCLSCKACATQCPLKVDVPVFKADFLALYHSRYLRPLKDHFLRHLEPTLAWLSYAPRLANRLFRSRLCNVLLARFVGIVDSPLLSEQTVRHGLRARQAPPFDANRIASFSEQQKRHSVLLLQDAFTTFYESQIVLATYDLLQKLGYTAYVLPFRPNGKGLHVKGFVREFTDLARANNTYLHSVADLGIPLIGIEPAITLTYRDEYVQASRQPSLGFRVYLLQEWLSQHTADIQQVLKQRNHTPPELAETASYLLLGHCTERTLEPASQNQWREVFTAFGLPLAIASVGCCGMCGMYGHETEHYTESEGIYEMSWQRHLPQVNAEKIVLATGHSCRSQVKRFSGFLPRHPVEVLLQTVGGPSAGPTHHVF